MNIFGRRLVPFSLLSPRIRSFTETVYFYVTVPLQDFSLICVYKSKLDIFTSCVWSVREFNETDKKDRFFNGYLVQQTFSFIRLRLDTCGFSSISVITVSYVHV